MKIKEINHKNYKLLKFNIIKSKILTKSHYFKNIKVKDVQYRLKNALNLIYFYHMYNKKILFVGNPLKINTKIKNLLAETKHVFIPQSAWITGIITNQNEHLKSLLFKQKNDIKLSSIAERIIELKKKSDLVVIIDEKLEIKALKESHMIGIPVITINSDLNIFDNTIDYKIPGNFILSKSKLKNNLFYSMMFSTIKKSTFIKTKLESHYKLNSLKKITETKIFEKKNYQKT